MLLSVCNLKMNHEIPLLFLTFISIIWFTLKINNKPIYFGEMRRKEIAKSTVELEKFDMICVIAVK